MGSIEIFSSSNNRNLFLKKWWLPHMEKKLVFKSFDDLFKNGW